MKHQYTGWQKPAWLKVQSLNSTSLEASTTWQQAGLLDFGEAEAIALAQQINAEWFLTDDAASRLFAQSVGLEVHGSLGVVLWSAAIGHLGRSDAESTLNQLAASTLWISSRVMDEAHAALDDLFSEG
jgi:predicted nucleic acid-binding protein